jgi:hypothetical protein
MKWNLYVLSEADEAVAIGEIWNDLNGVISVHRRFRTSGSEDVGGLRAEGFVDFHDAEAAWSQEGIGPLSYGSVEFERVMVWDKKSEMRLIIQDIRPHQGFFRIHDVRWIADYYVELTKLFKRPCQYIGLDEARGEGAGSGHFLREILRGGDCEGVVRDIDSYHFSTWYLQS